MRKHLKWIVGLMLLVLVFLLVRGRTPVSFPVPSPNGYDDFLGTAAIANRTFDDPEVRRIYSDDVSAASKEDLRNWVLQGSDAITLFQSGLTRKCSVPIQTTKQYPGTHSGEAGSLKLLTRFLVARATLAAMEGRTNEALVASLEAYDFAHRIGNGGLATDFLLSLSCEALVLRNLRSLGKDLTPEQCSEAIIVIDQIERAKARPEEAMRRTLDWRAATFDPAMLVRAKTRFWWQTGLDILKSRSPATLDSLPIRQLKNSLRWHKQEVDDLRKQLRRPIQP